VAQQHDKNNTLRDLLCKSRYRNSDRFHLG